MVTSKIGGGIVAACALVGSVMLERTLPPDPSNVFLMVGWGALCLVFLIGLALVFWPEKSSDVNDNKKDTPPPRLRSVGINMKGSRGNEIIGGHIEGFDEAINMEDNEGSKVIDTTTIGPDQEKPEKDR